MPAHSSTHASDKLACGIDGLPRTTTLLARGDCHIPSAEHRTQSHPSGRLTCHSSTDDTVSQRVHADRISVAIREDQTCLGSPVHFPPRPQNRSELVSERNNAVTPGLPVRDVNAAVSPIMETAGRLESVSHHSSRPSRISNSPNLATFAPGNIFSMTLAPSSFLLWMTTNQNCIHRSSFS